MCMHNMHTHPLPPPTTPHRQIIHTNQIDQMKFKFSTHYFLLSSRHCQVGTFQTGFVPFSFTVRFVSVLVSVFFILCLLQLLSSVFFSFLSYFCWATLFSYSFRLLRWFCSLSKLNTVHSIQHATRINIQNETDFCLTHSRY